MGGFIEVILWDGQNDKLEQSLDLIQKDNGGIISSVLAGAKLLSIIVSVMRDAEIFITNQHPCCKSSFCLS